VPPIVDKNNLKSFNIHMKQSVPIDSAEDFESEDFSDTSYPALHGAKKTPTVKARRNFNTDGMNFNAVAHKMQTAKNKLTAFGISHFASQKSINKPALGLSS
jgi:hypothetical protein